MGAWKKLNQQDVFVTTYNAKKYWSVSGAALEDTGVEVYFAESSSNLTYYLDSADLYNGEYEPLVYRSINQVYYRGYDNVTGSLQQSSSYDYSYESYKTAESRFLSQSAVIYSLPRSKVGTHIEPGSFNIGAEGLYVSGGYVDDDYFDSVGGFYDDGNGRLLQAIGDTTYASADTVVGNIFYSHGIAILTYPGIVNDFRVIPNVDVGWRSNTTIYTHNFNIKLADYEFNFTQNPTALTGSDNTLRDNLTGSYFQPYITTVGLYNDANELIAVAKLGQPLPKTRHTDMTIQIKLDI